MNRVVSWVLTLTILIGGTLLGHLLLQLMGKAHGRWECVTMFVPATLFGAWGWLRFRLAQQVPLREIIWAALFATFGCIILWRG